MKTIFLLYGGFCVFHLSVALAGDIKGTVKGSSKALENAVVYINKIEGKIFPPPKEPVRMDQTGLMFVPHVLPVLVGTTVTFPNNDPTMHNVFSPRKNNQFDLGTYRTGTTKQIVCKKPGVVPILCHIHHEMSAFVVVVETPYFAVTNNRGEYTITNVPPGQYQLTAWQERMQPEVQEIEVPATDALTVNYTFTR